MNLFLGGMLIGSALLLIGLSVPLLRGKVPMNWIYGVRFRESFHSDDAWYRINRYGAKQMIGWALPLLVLGGFALVLPLEGRDALVIVLSLTPAAAALAAAFFSYRYARRFGSRR